MIHTSQEAISLSNDSLATVKEGERGGGTLSTHRRIIQAKLPPHPPSCPSSFPKLNSASSLCNRRTIPLKPAIPPTPHNKNKKSIFTSPSCSSPSSASAIPHMEASFPLHALVHIVNFFPHHVPLAFIASNPMARIAGEMFRAEENYRWAAPASSSEEGSHRPGCAFPRTGGRESDSKDDKGMGGSGGLSRLMPRERGERETFEVYEAKRVRHAGVQLGSVIILYHDALGHCRQPCCPLPSVHRTPAASLHADAGMNPGGHVHHLLRESSFSFSSASPPPHTSRQSFLAEEKWLRSLWSLPRLACKAGLCGYSVMGEEDALPNERYPKEGHPHHPSCSSPSLRAMRHMEKDRGGDSAGVGGSRHYGSFGYSSVMLGNRPLLASGGLLLEEQSDEFSRIQFHTCYSPAGIPRRIYYLTGANKRSLHIWMREADEEEEEEKGKDMIKVVHGGDPPVCNASSDSCTREKKKEKVREEEEKSGDSLAYSKKSSSIHFFSPLPSMHDETIQREEVRAPYSALFSSFFPSSSPPPSQQEQQSNKKNNDVKTSGKTSSLTRSSRRSRITEAQLLQASRWWLERPMVSSLKYLEGPPPPPPPPSPGALLLSGDVSPVGEMEKSAVGSIFAKKNPMHPPPPPALRVHVYGNSTQRLFTVLQTLFPPSTNTLVVPSSSTFSTLSQESSSFSPAVAAAVGDGGGPSPFPAEASSSSSHEKAGRVVSSPGNELEQQIPPLLSLPQEEGGGQGKEKHEEGEEIRGRRERKGTPSSPSEWGSNGLSLSSSSSPLLVLEGLCLVGHPPQSWHLTEKTTTSALSPLHLAQLKILKIHGVYMTNKGIQKFLFGSRLDFSSMLLWGTSGKEKVLTQMEDGRGDASPGGRTSPAPFSATSSPFFSPESSSAAVLASGCGVGDERWGMNSLPRPRRGARGRFVGMRLTDLPHEPKGMGAMAGQPTSESCCRMTSSGGSSSTTRRSASRSGAIGETEGEDMRKAGESGKGKDTAVLPGAEKGKKEGERECCNDDKKNENGLRDTMDTIPIPSSPLPRGGITTILTPSNPSSEPPSSSSSLSHLLPQLEVADFSFAFALTQVPVYDHVISFVPPHVGGPLPPGVLPPMIGGGRGWCGLQQQEQQLLLLLPCLQVLNLSGTHINNDELWAIAGRRSKIGDQPPPTDSSTSSTSSSGSSPPAFVAAMRATCLVPRLHTLRLGCCASISDLHPLRHLPQLRILDVHATAVNDAAIAHFSDMDFTLLESLSLAECRHLHDVRPLGQLSALRELDLRHTPVRQGWSALKSCSALHILTIAADFAVAARLRQQQPELYHTPHLFFKSFHSLTVLHIENVPTLTSSGLALLAASRAPLRYLALLNTTRLESLSPLAALVTLERLSVEGADALQEEGERGEYKVAKGGDGCSSSRGGLQGLHTLTSLEELVLRRCARLWNFNDLHVLPALRLLDIRQNDVQHITTTSFESFFECRDDACVRCSSGVGCDRPPLPKLKVLLLSQCPLLTSLDVFSRLPSLRLLDARHCGIEGDCLSLLPSSSRCRPSREMGKAPRDPYLQRTVNLARCAKHENHNTSGSEGGEGEKGRSMVETNKRSSPLEVLYLGSCTKLTAVRFLPEEEVPSSLSTSVSPLSGCIPSLTTSHRVSSCLRVLDLSWTGVRDCGITQLCWLPHLDSLSLENCPFLKFLPFPMPFPCLRYLSLCNNPTLTTAELTRFLHLSNTSQPSRSTFPYLEEVDLSSTGVNSARPLVLLSHLCKLRFRQNILTHKGVMYFRRLPALEEVDLKGVVYASHENTEREENEEVLFIMRWMGKNSTQPFSSRDDVGKSGGLRDEGVPYPHCATTEVLPSRMGRGINSSSLPHSFSSSSSPPLPPPPSIPDLLLPPSRDSFLSLLDPLFTLPRGLRRVDLRGARLQRTKESGKKFLSSTSAAVSSSCGGVQRCSSLAFPEGSKAVDHHHTHCSGERERGRWEREVPSPTATMTIPHRDTPSLAPPPLYSHHRKGEEAGDSPSSFFSFSPLPPPPPASLLQPCLVQELAVDATEEVMQLLHPILLSEEPLLCHLEVLLMAVVDAPPAEEEDRKHHHHSASQNHRGGMDANRGVNAEKPIRKEKEWCSGVDGEVLEQFLRVLRWRRPLLSIRFI